jgi:hypothetical protein
MTMRPSILLLLLPALEIGISKDVATETAPDVVFRLALRSRF